MSLHNASFTAIFFKTRLLTTSTNAEEKLASVNHNDNYKC